MTVSRPSRTIVQTKLEMTYSSNHDEQESHAAPENKNIHSNNQRIYAALTTKK